MIVKNEKKAARAAKYRALRVELRKTIKNPKTSPEQRYEAQLKLAKLPRNASDMRVRNRCKVSGRPRAYIRKFQMSRLAFRQYASRGLLPGVIKASW
jgi:small subunit ribosomal protein S14